MTAILDIVTCIHAGQVMQMTTGEVIDHVSPDSTADTPMSKALKITGYTPSPRLTDRPHVARCWQGATEEIARLAHRMCPFATVLIAPDWRGISDRWAGEAWQKDNIIFLKINDQWSEGWITNFFHETWHIMSQKLTPDTYQMCTQVVEKTPEIGDPEYMDTPEEKLARMFAHWAMAVWMGWQSVEDNPRAILSPSSIFAAIYNGYFARVAMAGQEQAA